MLAVAYARLFGPKNKRTPSGEPIQIASQPFDLSKTSPVEAIAQAARKWHGYMIPLDAAKLHAHWVLVAEYNVVIPPHRTASTPKYQKVFYFEYVPERELVKHKGLTGKIPNHFETSWYLKRVVK